MKARWILAGLVVIVAFVVVWLRGERESPALAIPTEPARETPVQEVELAAPPSSELPEDVASAGSVREELQPSPARSPDETKEAEIRARVVFPGGAPAVGARYELHGWEANDERVRRHGRPESWEDREGTLGDDGILGVRFAAPGAYQFVLEVGSKGYGTLKWRWSTIEPGQVLDLGVLELVAGGTIEGRIVDADGEAVSGGWFVYARSDVLRGAEGRDRSQVIVAADPDGRFRAVDVMPGRVELSAYDDGVWTEKTSVQLRSGEAVVADIVTRRKESLRRIQVRATPRRRDAPIPDAAYVGLIGPDGVRRACESSGGVVFWFPDVDPGEHDLVIDDPRFHAITRTVEAGENVEVTLEGACSLQLVVRGPDGNRVERFSALPTVRGRSYWPQQFEDTETGLIEGLTPGDHRVTVRAGDLAGVADVDGLAQGERRTVAVTLAETCSVSGHVRHADGEPARAVVGVIPEGWLLNVNVAESETDEQGAFELASVLPGSYRLRATGTNDVGVSESIELVSGVQRDVELVLPRGAFVAGRVIAPPGASCEGLTVSLVPKSGAGLQRQQRLAADGQFDLGPVGPGPCAVLLLLESIRNRRSGFSRSSNAAITLAKVELADGERLERDFEVEGFPGTVALRVLVDGKPLAGAVVSLRTGEGPERLEVSGNTDADGEFGPVPAFPRAWTVSVSDPDESWTYTHSEPVVVDEARETRTRIEIWLAEGTLTILDAESGAPLAGRTIGVLARDDAYPFARRMTDESGRARWKLPACEVRFCLEPADAERTTSIQGWPTCDSAHTVKFTWTSAGPLVHEVRL